MRGILEWWFQFQDGRNEICPYMWIGPFFVWWERGKMRVSFYAVPE